MAFCLSHLSESASFTSYKQFIVHFKVFLFSPMVNYIKASETEVSVNAMLFSELPDTSVRVLSTGRTSRRSIQREGPINPRKKHARMPDLVKSSPSMNALWRTEARPYPLKPSHRPTAPSCIA